MSNLTEEVVSEIKAMQDIGMVLPANVFDVLKKEDLDALKCMSVSEMADYVIMIASLKE